MSKKKMPRAAMTLKDFHGGSIPSDLPLPSAPGMTVDRSAFERPSSAPWMSPTLGRGFGGDRGGGYNRQGAPNGVRTFEEKASYFPNPANIGRNYDEDERKPVDSRPRSSHSVDRYEDLDRYEERRPVYEKVVDRYSNEEKGGFEARGLPSNDRFSRTQPPRQGESDNYVHDEFGLIAPRLPERETQLTSEKLQVRPQDTHSSAPSEQAAFGKHSQNMSGPPFVAQHASSPPPRGWRAGAQQPVVPVAPVAAPRGGSDPAPNVWTARREGEYRVLPGDGAGNDNTPSSPWRHQRPVDAGMVDKGAPTRWPGDRRPLPEQPKEASVRPNAYGSGYVSDGGRPAFNPDVAQFQAGGHPSAETGQPGYLSDPGRGPYPDGGRVSYSDSGRGMRYGEGRGRGLGDGNRGDYPEADVRGYPDAGRGPYHEPARDRGDNRVHYVDQGRVGFGAEAARASYPNEVRRGYMEDNRWAAGAGYNDPERAVEPERGAYLDSRAYPEAGRIGFDSGRPMYVDGSRGGYGEVVNNGELGRGVGFPDRVPYSDSGRGGYGRGAYAERGGYPDSYVPDNAEGGRHAYVPEPPRDNYMPNANRGAHISESSRLPYGGDRDKGGYVDGSRGVYGADRERNGSSYGRIRSPDVLASQTESSRAPIAAPALPADPIQTTTATAAARPEQAERPKLKLLPRSKPLEKVLEPPVEAIIHEETVKESRLIVSEKRLVEQIPLAEPVDSGASDSSVAAGYQASENGDDSSRLAGRPRLNLKPRSKVTEPAVEDGPGKVRNTVFGGARPRELILKERGGDDALIIGLEPNVTPGARQDVRRESDRKDNSPYRKDGRKEENVRRDADRFDNRREQDRAESRRDIEKQERSRDINKQDSWRRPADPPAPSSPSMGARNPATASASVDPVPATTPGKFGHTAPVSAADLAQAFSRSSSLGSAIGGAARGSMNQRSALSPLARSPVQVLGSSYLNGSAGPYGASPKDAPFSRLAEGPAPSQPSQGRDVFAPSGGIFGGDRLNNGPGTVKSGSYGSGSNDPSRSASFGRHEGALVHDARDWNDGSDDYPGKRGLPVRRSYD